MEVEGRCELPADLHVALYRIAQEALNNVVKHAQASQVAVRLRCTPRVPSPSLGEGKKGGVQVELTIRDDGRGFDPGDVSPERMGLGIMRERAEAVGAQLGIVSQAGQGTRLAVVWPGDKGRRTADNQTAENADERTEIDSSHDRGRPRHGTHRIGDFSKSQ